MTAAAKRPSGRHSSWKPLGAALLLSLLFHAIGSIVFDASGVASTRRPPPAPLVTFLSPTADAPSFIDFRRSLALNDPSASSLPNPHGFSRPTITRYPQVPSIIESRQNDPQLLPRKPIDPATVSILPQATLAKVLDERAAKLPVGFTDVETMEQVITRSKPESTFLIDGPIRERELLSLASIPLVRSPAPPHPTVVRIAVAPIGDVKFAVIEKGSGAEDKDARGLDIIRRWRFKPVAEQTGDQWGKVSVYWVADAAVP